LVADGVMEGMGVGVLVVESVGVLDGVGALVVESMGVLDGVFSNSASSTRFRHSCNPSTCSCCAGCTPCGLQVDDDGAGEITRDGLSSAFGDASDRRCDRRCVRDHASHLRWHCGHEYQRRIVQGVEGVTVPNCEPQVASGANCDGDGLMNEVLA
jgi:hypothetical protein